MHACLCVLKTAVHILRTMYTPAARWGRHTASGHVEVSRVIIFFFKQDFITSFFNWIEHCCLRLARALRGLKVVLFGEEAAVQEEIWVRLCALGVDDKAREAYSPSVSSQSPGSTSLSTELQLSPQVLRASENWHRPGKRNHSLPLLKIYSSHLREVSELKFLTSRMLIDLLLPQSCNC